MPRVKIPINFGFSSNPNGTTPTYISSASGSFTSESANVLEPVSNVTVSVVVRSSGNPATVYQAETGTATYTSFSTDNQGNVPGWVDPGSYSVIATSEGGFAGATVAFEAVRGDGVTNVAAAAVDMTQLAQNVLNALVPTGTIMDFAGQVCPTGFCFGDNSVYPIGTAGSTYYALSQICGTTWNLGAEGAGNFRVPDLRGVALVGSGTNSRVATTSHALAANGGEETHELLAAESGINGNGYTSGTGALALPGAVVGAYLGFDYSNTGSFTAGSNTVGGPGVSAVGLFVGPEVPALSLEARNADSAHNNLQPFVVTQRIIKL